MDELLKEIGKFHGEIGHGVAIGLKMCFAVKKAFGIESFKEIEGVSIVETSRCVPDAIQYIVHSCAGNRRLIIKDYGKLAASFIDRKTMKAYRVSVKPDIFRSKRWEEILKIKGGSGVKDDELQAFEILKIPDDELFIVKEVKVRVPVPAKRPCECLMHGKYFCSVCGESVAERALKSQNGSPVCVTCSDAEAVKCINIEKERYWEPCA
ncbi:MAG: FmdE family protein [bacterium]